MEHSFSLCVCVCVCVWCVCVCVCVCETEDQEGNLRAQRVFVMNDGVNTMSCYSNGRISYPD